MSDIIIRDAYEHNLKHIDLEIPLNAFTCVTGCSGCGKSSLVFDTIYAESQRGFLEGMTGNLYGQRLMSKPKVGSVENLRPAMNVSQNYYNVNPRSTVGTVTEVAYYLRSLFAVVNGDASRGIRESTFSPNNPESCCPNCAGLGVESVVSESLLIPDREVTLRDGGILFFKGPSDGKMQRLLEALCDHYGIDVNKKVSQLTERELDLLLHADDHVRCKLSYREGKRRKQHYEQLRGAVAAIQGYLAGIDSTGSPAAFAAYMEERPCHVCGGAKLRKDILAYQVSGLNYGEAERMELRSLRAWLREVQGEYASHPRGDTVSQLVEGMTRGLDALAELDVDYLSLGRTIPSLSDGERQRVRIATQLTCPLRGLLYILDEPCKGLHYRDVGRIIHATRDLVARENTVIAIEHNGRYVASADKIVELGPVGGPQGGYLIDESHGTVPSEGPLSLKSARKFDRYIRIDDINFRNICDQSVKIPIGGITCITGVSGSGKSTLATVVANCLEGRSAGYCKTFSGGEFIGRCIRVNQAPIGKTSRSTVVSYLGIFDEVRTLFAKTDAARALKLGASQFSMNTKGGRCECCRGTGVQEIELNYLPSTYIPCPACGGKRFSDRVLAVEYKGMTILDVLERPVSDIVEVFEGNRKIHAVLSSMMDLGLGYLRLGQMSMNLSGGEAQRIKLAKALGTPSHGGNMYILDEPTSGLNGADIQRFVAILLSLQAKGDTVLAIEHNIEFVAAVADYVIDFGTSCGKAGGRVAAQGDPATVFSDESSSLFGIAELQV
ncbi:MAG: ATP-binding cassette domain-containing protein [Olsenella umbonata]|nr:ATP-binding cassette domain-containing protein [Parafannyhessea umbonata]